MPNSPFWAAYLCARLTKRLPRRRLHLSPFVGILLCGSCCGAIGLIAPTMLGQRVDVRVGIAFCLGVQALGPDVGEGADGVARLGRSRLIHRTVDAEINQISKIVAIERDLGGFDVAVEQTDLVRSMHRFGDLVDDADCSSGIQRPVRLCATQYLISCQIRAQTNIPESPLASRLGHAILCRMSPDQRASAQVRQQIAKPVTAYSKPSIARHCYCR